MYGALQQFISAECTSVVLSPKSVNLTTTRRSRRVSPSTTTSCQPSVTMKFSGLMSRWNTPRSWQTATASHICANMLAMSFSRVRLRSLPGLRVLSSDGVGGVRAVLSDDTDEVMEQSLSEEGEVDRSEGS